MHLRMKYAFFIAVILTVTSLSAKNGDTTRIRTHEKVLIQTNPAIGHTNYSAWGEFPSRNRKFQKMYLELTFQCPPGMTCGEWDYLNYIWLGKRHGEKKDTLNWEIARFITPYGLQFDKNWNHTWKFDISDFSDLFFDSVEIWYQHTGYEAKNGRGWLITLDFTMIEGPPVREIKKIDLLWRKSIPYGNDSVFAARTPEIKYKCGPETGEIRYKIIQTGHGMDQPHNCAEFCPKYRYIRHDYETDTSLVWRDNCGENPVYPQGGTWIYDRTNWCPGAEVWEYNLDKKVLPNSEHTMDLDMQSYTRVSGSGNYVIAVYLIEYGKYAFETDASVEEIIRPTTELQYKRLNPACGEPRIVFRNNGINELNQVLFEYGWEGSKLQRVEWTGNLKFGEKKQLDLPYLKSRAASGTRFVCQIIWVNYREDLYKENNRIYSLPSTLTPELPGRIEIVLRTNNAASENYYSLTKSDGTVILKKGNFSNNTFYRDTVNLAAGCYLLNLMDDGPPPSNYPLNKDGLGWWANSNDGTGLFQIRNPGNNSLIQLFNVDFGTGLWYQFHVGNFVAPQSAVPGLRVYPNPVHNDMIIDLGANTEEELNIYMYSNSGQLVMRQKRTGFLEALQFVDFTQKAAGVYVLKIQVGNRTLTQKMIIN